MEQNKTFGELRKEGWQVSVRTTIPTEKEISKLLDDGYELELVGLSTGVLVKKEKTLSKDNDLQ